jgi:hypothetical protein
VHGKGASEINKQNEGECNGIGEMSIVPLEPENYRMMHKLKTSIEI